MAEKGGASWVTPTLTFRPHFLIFSPKLGEGLGKGFSAQRFAFHLGSVRLQPASCRHRSLGWLEVSALVGPSATYGSLHAGSGRARSGSLPTALDGPPVPRWFLSSGPCCGLRAAGRLSPAAPPQGAEGRTRPRLSRVGPHPLLLCFQFLDFAVTRQRVLLQRA